MKKIALFVLMMFFYSPMAFGDALFGNLPNEVGIWGSTNGYTASKVTRGTAGCFKGKRHVPLSGNGKKLTAVFHHPVYDEETAIVSNVVFEFNPPVSAGTARALAVKLVPIVGTRGPTHKQKIKAKKGNPCLTAAGGFEERYTKDWILEFLLAPGGKKIQKLSMYNDYVR